jgi:hypothetical protein
MHRGKGSDWKGMNCRFGTPGDYHIGFASLNPMESVRNCFVSGGASANCGSRSTLGA